VAVLDDGIDYAHPELGGASFPNSVVVGGYDFVYSETHGPTEDPSPSCNNSSGECESHGTSVAGIIAGRGKSGETTGVAPEAKILGLRIGDNTGLPSRHILAALDWVVAKRAQYNIRVVNMSLGFPFYFASACDSDPGAAAFKNVFQKLVDAKVAVVVASGNENQRNGLAFPSCLSKAISVGAVYDGNIGGVGFGGEHPCDDATTASDQVTCYSNSANYLTILGPSHNARSPQAGVGALRGSYNPEFGGTSAATPYVAGAIAALMSVDTNKGRTPAEYAQILRNTGKPILDSKSGFTVPRVDLEKAFNALSGSSTSATLSVGGVVAACNSSVNVPISISAVQGLTSVDFRVAFDASKLSVDTVKFGALTDPWFTSGSGSFDKAQSGSVRITLSGPALSGSGPVAIIVFKTAATASGTVNLTMNSVQVNSAASTGTAGTASITCGNSTPKNNVYFAPAAAKFNGANGERFVSDFRIINTGNAVASVDIFLLAKADNSTAATQSVAIGPGHSAEFNDIVKSVFGLDAGGGALMFASSQPLVITSNLYTPNTVCADRGGSFGQFITTPSRAEATKRQRIPHLLSYTAYRTNLGFVNTSNAAASVTVTIRGSEGQTLGSKTYNIGPYGWQQVGNVFGALNAGSSRSAYAEVTSNQNILTYASIVDNKTGDPFYVSGQNY
jgi:hypothetical protein